MDLASLIPPRRPGQRASRADPTPPEERLAAAVKIDENGCHVWQRSLSSRGYGALTIVGKRWYAHRLAYTLAHGDIPEGKQIDHLCRNRACCNPDHLEAVTSRENTLRGMGPHLTAMRHRSKTHCCHGHLLDEANTYLSKAGKRHCRTCQLARSRARKRRIRLETVGFAGKAPVTHCPHGHAYDEANTIIDGAGAKVCRTCKNAYNRRWKRQRRANNSPA